MTPGSRNEERESNVDKNALRNWPQPSVTGCWIRTHPRSRRETSHGWRRKERSTFPSAPSLHGSKAFPGGLPHALDCPCVGAEGGSSSSLALSLTETPGGEARSMGHVMSRCTCEKGAGVAPELVGLALARLRDQHGGLQ